MFKRGDSIAVTVCGGVEVVLKFWETKGNMILVTNEEEYDRLAHGLDAPWPVAFHPEEVRMLESETNEAAHENNDSQSIRI
jgi:hypothetical protein